MLLKCEQIQKYINQDDDSEEQQNVL